MSSSEVLTEIIRDDLDWISLDDLAGTNNTWVKVLKIDESRRRMIFKIKFGKDAIAPRHFHYAEAVAYTISGRWYYDEGEFGPGDIAYERAGSDHTPGSKDGAELFIVFDAPEGETRLLGNYGPDGSIVDLDFAFFMSIANLSK